MFSNLTLLYGLFNPQKKDKLASKGSPIIRKLKVMWVKEFEVICLN